MADKMACYLFIRKYPGEYTTTLLSNDEKVIIQNKNYQIYYLSGSTYHLSYPIIIKDSSHIAIFSLPDSDGNITKLALAPQTPGKEQPGLKNYYDKEVIGDIDNCRNCLVSGLYISPEIGQSNKNLNRAFEITGEYTYITFYNIGLDDLIPGGYFNAKNIGHIAIERFWVSGENSEKILHSPAIKIQDCSSITLRDIRLTDFKTMPSTPGVGIPDLGVIAIINPERFRILRTIITLKDSATEYVAGIYIMFDGKNNFKKYLDEWGGAIKVYGKILNSLIYRVSGKWDPDWKGVVLTAISEHQRPRYNLIHGRILIINTSLPDRRGRAHKYSLPNLRVGYWICPKTASTGRPTKRAALNPIRPAVKGRTTITDFDGGADNPATTPDSSIINTDILTTTNNESRIDSLKATKRVSNFGETRMASGTVLSLLIPFLTAIFK